MIKILRALIWLILIIVVLLFIWFSLAFPDEIIRHYGKDGKRIGFSKREGNRETHYDENWNRRGGYSIYKDDRVNHFDGRWEREGHDDYEDNLDHERKD